MRRPKREALPPALRDEFPEPKELGGKGGGSGDIVVTAIPLRKRFTSVFSNKQKREQYDV